MKKDLPVSEQLKKKYHKTEEVSNFKEMLYRSADIYRSRTAFKTKDKNEIKHKSNIIDKKKKKNQKKKKIHNRGY